jgi:DNA invertase Pin-like site-specific DNA recombinase
MLQREFMNPFRIRGMLLQANTTAQYVRMSTDMQTHSIENQVAAIALWAARRGITIVRSYEDAGKSGLRLSGRAALQELISDVKSGQADFSIVLVYDVSRWGRFQDSDESAYYEFICKEAGVTVEYCAESSKMTAASRRPSSRTSNVPWPGNTAGNSP